MIEYVTLAETLNFTKAANILHITQPVLSRHIILIEEVFNAKLFLRDTRSVSLTIAGKIVYDDFKEMIRLYNQTFDKVSLQSNDTGNIVISSPYYWTPDYTELIIFEYSKLYPQNKIEVISCQPHDGYLQLKENISDLLLICDFGTAPDNSIRRSNFTNELMSVMMPNDHFLTHEKSVSIKDLEGCTLVLFDPEDPYNRVLNEKVQQLFSINKIETKDIIYSQQVDTIAIDIKKTKGIAVIPYCLRYMNRSYATVIPLRKDELIMHVCFYYKLENKNPLIPQLLQIANNIFINK